MDTQPFAKGKRLPRPPLKRYTSRRRGCIYRCLVSKRTSCKGVVRLHPTTVPMCLCCGTSVYEEEDLFIVNCPYFHTTCKNCIVVSSDGKGHCPICNCTFSDLTVISSGSEWQTSKQTLKIHIECIIFRNGQMVFWRIVVKKITEIVFFYLLRFTQCSSIIVGFDAIKLKCILPLY